jgi:SAM-dependent methyltransferase
MPADRPHALPGDEVFGDVARTYDRYRPGYPSDVYDLLRDTCGTGPGTQAFEVGPGTGQATVELLRLGVERLHLVEPDARLAEVLAERIAPYRAGRRVTNEPSRFEESTAPEGEFNLGVAATVLHWLNQRTALAKAARLLRPGGWFVAWWNVFGDPDRPDAFHEATRDILEDRGGVDPTRDQRMLFALDTAARANDLRTTGLFEPARHELFRRDVTFDAEGIVGLYRTFPNVSRRPPAERDAVLAALGRVAEEQFGGRVTRPILTPVTLARRR